MKKPPSGETGPDLVTIRVFVNEFDAKLAKSVLQATGVESMLISDDCGGMRPFLSMTQGIKLVVRPEDAARAAKVLGNNA
jgi:hypothetical protein